jgi:hypothetical protein
MAEIDTDSLRRFAEELNKTTLSESQKNKLLEICSKKLNLFDRSLTNVVDSLEELEQEVKDGTKTYKDVGGDLKYYQKEINKLTDATKKHEAQEKLNQLASKATGQVLGDLGKDIVKVGIGAAFNYFKNQLMTGVRGIMGDGSPFQVAADLQTAAIDSGAQAAQGIAGAAQTAGAALMMIPHPASMVVGGLLELGGALLDFGAKQTAEALKFQVEVVSKQLEKTYTAFKTATASGALFADGLTGLVKSAHAAGLDTATFANVLKTNAAELAHSGMGVSGGADFIAKAMKKGGDSARNGLLNLGFSLEEQVGLYAETTARLKRYGAAITPDKVASETQKYAENLRLISALTGEDAKAKIKQSEEQNKVLAFQQYLAGKTPEQQRAINEAMALMTEQEKKNLRERAVFGGQVVSQEGALYETLYDGTKQKGEAVFKALENNELTAKSVAEANAQYRDQINKSVLAQKEVGQAALLGINPAIQGVATAGVELIEQGRMQTKESVKNAEELVKKQKETQDKLTEGVNASVVALNNLKKDIEDLLLPKIKDFATAVPKILEGFRKKMEDLGLLDKADAKKPPDFTPSNSGNKSVDDAINWIASLGDTDLGKLGKWFSAHLSGDNVYADGGIAQGSTKGFAATLHGTEAVVPLPDGKTIPVNLNAQSIAEALTMASKGPTNADQTQMMETLKQNMRDQNITSSASVRTTQSAEDLLLQLVKLGEDHAKMQKAIIASMNDHKSISAKILGVSY